MPPGNNLFHYMLMPDRLEYAKQILKSRMLQRIMMRLDKFLVSMEVGSRSQVKSILKKGIVTVNGAICKDADFKINEITDKIVYQGRELSYVKFRYFILNKPGGVVTATRDNHDKTVMDLLTDIPKKDFFPVGRLDKDTEGLLLITNDGSLAHALLAPKKHVDKTYFVGLRDQITKEAVRSLELGLDIGEDKPTLPAKVQILSEKEIHLTIQEGKFHQVKRMLSAVGNEVIYLKRISFGSLILEESLKPGTYRELTVEEIEILKKDAGQ